MTVVCLSAPLAVACRHAETPHAVKDDVKRGVEKTGEGIEKAGHKVENAGKK